MIFIASSIYVSNFLLPQLKRQLQPNIPHNMKHHHTTKFSFAKEKFSCRHIFTQGRMEAHSEIFHSQQLPSPRILCHYKYLKHIALQPSLSLSHRHTSIHLFLFLLCCTIPLSDPLLPSFLLALQFLSLYTHFLTLYLYFLLHNSSNTNILLLKAHLYSLAFNTNKTYFVP